MGRGTSTIKLDVQDLLTGTKHTERFRSGDMVEVTELDDHTCQFLYRNDGQIHLMDPHSFEMYEVPESVLDERQLQLLKPDMTVHLSMFQPDPEVPGKPISIKLPAQAIYEVKETHASAAQANKGTVYKNADLENGIKVQVPDFVNVGDKVVVDTETGKYVKRA
ncbi:elongation factor P, C-terminal-domain-containing protein [Gamsiella multidivaricata]|uniref:elongation factor P, C-terminal-domain-containing protein n=1 Tax=Gamsiella multidivaricata TaxID=101098 RepID=UPI00221FB8FB|nr:elongation factor P, C-terminal-domain-containing protein [Gamsiella multidivaricata]KAI7828189.1 elongation factor P, C-terminal-domain-containing protein [Gamsiella multidivaricata]